MARVPLYRRVIAAEGCGGQATRADIPASNTEIHPVSDIASFNVPHTRMMVVARMCPLQDKISR